MFYLIKRILFALLLINFAEAEDCISDTSVYSCNTIINDKTGKSTGGINCKVPNMPNMNIFANDVFDRQGNLKSYFGTGATVCHVLGWLNEGASNLSKVTGMQVDIRDELTLNIHHMPGSVGGQTGGLENLELDSDAFAGYGLGTPKLKYQPDGNRFASHMNTIVVHEFFHIIQGIVKTKYIYEHFDDDEFEGDRGWLVEGSARMFEDIVYDADNPYAEPGFSPMYKGDDIEDILSDIISHSTRYKTFMFWKLLQGHCQLDFYKMLGDPFRNFNDVAQSCSTVPDVYNDKLAGAFVLYNWAMILHNDLSLIEGDELSYIPGIKKKVTKMHKPDFKSHLDLKTMVDSKLPKFSAKSFLLTQETISDACADINLTLNATGDLKLVAVRVSDNGSKDISNNFMMQTNDTPYILTDEDKKGDLFITITNTTAQDIAIDKFQLDKENGEDTPVTTIDGAIETTISWSQSCDINMDLTLEGNNVIQDVKDVEYSGIEHAYVPTEGHIYPNTRYTASATGEKREKSVLEESKLEENPVDIYAIVKTPGGSKFKHYQAHNFGQLNLGEFAVIEVKSKRIESSYTSSGGSSGSSGSSGGSSGGGTSVRTYDECIDSEKKYTCQCVPCEYIIYGLENTVQYGPIGDAEVEIIRADTYGNTNQVVYRGSTSNEEDLFKSGIIKFTKDDYTKFEDEVYYVVDAKGGSDLDRDDDLVKDDTSTPNNGTIHAIIKGSDLKTVSFRVNALTEAIYQVSGDLLGVNYDADKLQGKLATAAKKLFKEKTFIFNNELEINYHDVLLWTPGVDKKKLFKPYDTFVEPIVVKTYADEDRVKESYRLIYEKLDTDAPQLTPLALEIPHTIPNNSIIGKVSIESEGISGIDHIELHGDANSTFSIDKEGLVKVVDASALILDAVYKLDMVAVGLDGKRSISMELIVKVIEGVPLADPNATVPMLESVVLNDILENSPAGTPVGQANFVDTSLNIVSYRLSGEDNSSFSIDNTGEITVANGADIDYEKSDTYTVKISAINEAGNESFPVSLSFNVINEIDTPLHDLVYLTHLSENVPIGTVVGEIVKLREGRSPITSFDILNPNVPFAIDVNGTIRTTGYINYEDVDEYNLLAIAKTDSGNGNKVDLQILITDIYPETGKPTIQPFTATIDENSYAGIEVGQLDINQGASPVELIELRGTGHSNFTVDVNGTIVVTDNATLDYEEKNTYALQAIAHNANGSSVLVSVDITLNNLNDEAATLKDFTKNIEENIVEGTIVGSVDIVNMGESEIEYFELIGEGNNSFVIDNLGVIRVASSAVLDFENQNIFELQVVAHSSTGASFPVAMNIYLKNIPEHVPTLKPLIATVEEESPLGTIVGRVEEEIGGDSPILSYELNNTSVFMVTSSGEIILNAPLDASKKDFYELSMTATNSAGVSAPVSIKFNISIPDVIAPVIELVGPSTLSIVEGSIYNDLGARATDNIDGDITSKINVDNPVDTSSPVGTQFIIRYNVEDLAGNVAAEVTRSVIIVRDLNINLKDWKANGDGNWVLQEDNRSVLQTLNANPTIFHNNVNSQSEVFELTGGITVKTTGDDDFIGFVLGYNDGDLVRDDVDYLLIDWKQADQTDGKKGLAISRVTGPITPGAWAHNATAGVTELQRGKTLGNIGWKDNTEYIFKIIYTESLVEVYINDVKELNITGTYPDGAYGFYNYSQGEVLYSALFAENTTAIHLVANAGIDRSVAFGSEVILDASGSTSTNQIISYRWLEDGVLLGSEEIVIIDSFSVGEHNITLSIEDIEGNTDIDHVNILITNSL